ncbi:nucleotidyltransferase AbiEii toxin of type IV toxin-antitoxin system [Agrobacterium vitis]|nr:nucleotidyltransferase AbiEii toxin of type IV toxin-antitoxin system [Agrobacterium vitis]
MNTPNPSRWADLFDAAMSVVDQANEAGIGMTDWTFGGGTALMLQIGHRDSHDIDLFVSDPQYLPYLNPQTQSYSLSITPSDYETDGTHALKIVFDGIGEIDFICCGTVTTEPTRDIEVKGRRILLETPAEIIAKKIVFRGKRLQPRDIFDIAAATTSLDEDVLVDALSPFARQCAEALHVAEAMDPDFAAAIMSKLLSRDTFSTLHQTAQTTTCRLLQRVVKSME